MKKFFSIAALALAMSTGVQAQTDVVPNRMIVSSKVDSKAYAVEHVDSIYFARKEGKVKANVEFISYEKNEDEGDIVYVKVTRTDPKSTFKIDVLPTNTAKRYDDITFARYFEHSLLLRNSQKTLHRASSPASHVSSQPTLRTPL